MIVRSATIADAPGMVALLNNIIRIGGTTAHETLFDEEEMIAHYIQPETLVSCFVAVEGDETLGFQFLSWPLEQLGKMPDGWAFIASFVAPQAAGKGVGRALFDKTLAAAKTAKVRTIDATIRADNGSGLGYYGHMGFVDYNILPAVPLQDGTPVDRIQKRFDLIV